MPKKLTQKRLKELLDYNPNTGVFVWEISPSPYVHIGMIAGSINSRGYRNIKLDKVLYRAARLAWLFTEGYFPEYQIDHINMVKDDDRRCNLRHVTASCNCKNKGITKANKSGVVGVCWHKGVKKWVATIKYKKVLHLGCCKNIQDAAKIRWEAEKKYGYPNCNTTSSAYLYLKEKGAL